MNDGGQNGDAVAGDGISILLCFLIILQDRWSSITSELKMLTLCVCHQNERNMNFICMIPNASIPEVGQAGYTVYPNPSNDFVYITSSSGVSLNCVVYNLSGQKLMEKQADWK